MAGEFVLIRELGPREGFQTLPSIYPTAKKLELIEALCKTGVREIEAASFVKPDRVPQMADAEDVVRGLPEAGQTKFLGLYLNREGFERAEKTGRLSNSGWIYSAASAQFLKRNNNREFSDVLKEIPSWLEAFKSFKKDFHGVMISTAFGCNYEGEIAPARVVDQLVQIKAKAAEGGTSFREISLADTMGWGTPKKIKELVAAVRREFPQTAISLHLHDTRGTGIANVQAGLDAGVRIFESSVGGIGGCPFAKGAAGNVCSEDLIYLLHSEGFETGIDLAAYVEAARAAEKILGISLPGKYFRV